MRCSAHDLAVGPDGLCALCRRSAGVAYVAQQLAPQAPSYDVIRMVGACVFLVSFAAVGWVLTGADPVAPVAAHARVQRGPVPPSAATPKPTQAFDPHKDPAAQDNADPSAEEIWRADEERRQREQNQRYEQAQRDDYALASARSGVRVEMYTTSWCGVCKRAKAYMSEHGISYVEYDVENDESARARAFAVNPGGGVPTFIVDHNDVLVGFSPGALEASIEAAARRRMGT
jgi:glutaredoxin